MDIGYIGKKLKGYELLKPLPFSTGQSLYIDANIPMLFSYTSIFRESRRLVFSHAAAHVKLRHGLDTRSARMKQSHVPAAYFIPSFLTLETGRLPAK